jgi:mRNA interferase RelE/StbE
MDVAVTQKALKQLKKLPKFVQLLVTERLKKLRLDIFFGIERLTGYNDVYRLRVGDYRIVYKIVGKKAFVILIGHRKEIYELLSRLLGR